MTYRSRGRGIIEIAVAVTFVGFLVGFVTVLCVGNYFRAKRAQERQRQRREAMRGGGSGGGGGGSMLPPRPDSPGSQYSATSSAYTDEGPAETQHLLHKRKPHSLHLGGASGTGRATTNKHLYRTQQLNPQHRQSSIGQQSAPYSDVETDLLIIPEETTNYDRNGASSDMMSV